MNTTSRESVSKTDERIDKLADQLSTLVEIVSTKVVTPAPIKAVEETCITCGGAHSWYNCPTTDNNQASVCATTGTYNQVNPPNRVSNQMAPPGFAPVQNNGQNRFNQNQVQGNNFNRGNNFHGNQGFQAQNNHASNFQNQGFQNQPFQVPNNQVQQEFSNDFSSYKRNNDQMMRNMQNQINSLKGDLKNEIQNTIKSQQAVMMNQQTTFQNNLQNMICGLFQNQASTLGTLPSNTIPNPKGEMKAITTRSGVAYEGPSIPTNPSPKKVVERETEETTDKEQSNFQGSTAQIPPPVTPISILEPDVPKTLPKTTPISEPDVPKSLPKPNIPYPSRLNQENFCEKASYQKEKIFQMFQDLRFDISFADALFLMPRFAPTIRNLLMNKEKLLELAKIPLNENCSAMLLKKLPEKLGDPGKFLIPCNFPGMDVCHALADLGASINLMPLSFWKKLSLPELTPTRMTLELADRSITHPKGLAEDVYVKVGKFHFPTDFVVVNFEADPRVPLILGRSFLRTGRALIDVYGEEITLRVDNEAVTFNLDQTTRYSSTNDKSVNRIDIIDAVCEEYALKLLGFSNNDSSGGNPTPTSEPLTSEFILEEIEAYLKDDSISPKIDHADCDPEGDICLIEKLLNNDPFQLPPMDLKQSEVTEAKSSIEEPPELELKDLPSHLEYLKLWKETKQVYQVIIAKDWDLPFERHVDDASDLAIGAGFRTTKDNQLSAIHYARKTLTKLKYITLPRKENAWPLVVSFGKVSEYLVLTKEHRANGHLAYKVPNEQQYSKPRLLRWFFSYRMLNITHPEYKNKEVEAKALPTNDARVVVKFLKSLFARFGTPRAIINDRGTYFCNDQFTKVMFKYGVTHRLATAYHPQTNGQVEVSNRGLKRILERTVGENRASWSDKLDDALWAFRTAFKHQLVVRLTS
ncbi:reverse transcriptase domain-containing protein [Tanacetum coccineum]